MQIDTGLINRYSRPGPRYTSYPTAAEFTDDFPVEQWPEMVRSAAKGRLASLYLHVPFCRSLCYFCACNKIITTSREPVANYLEALRREVEGYADLLGDAVLDHMHWGGGTPNYLTADEMRSVLGWLRDAFPRWSADAELSIELDPRTTSMEQITALGELGFTRMSCGVQDFDPVVQEAVNRIQSPEQTAELCAAARQAGLHSINIDLIYGLPQQTEPAFLRTLELVNEIQPDRIALYGYAHVAWVSKVQTTFRRFDLPRPDERIRLLAMAIEFLTQNGYEYIGMDHFALPSDRLAIARREGKLRRNFMGYTDRVAEPLIGLGPSAISSLPQALAQNDKDLRGYESRLADRRLPLVRGVLRTEEDRRTGALIERILCERRLDIERFESEWHTDFSSSYPTAVQGLTALAADGIIERDARGFSVTPLGAFFLRNIAMLFDRYLPAHAQRQAPVFSQAL